MRRDTAPARDQVDLATSDVNQIITSLDEEHGSHLVKMVRFPVYGEISVSVVSDATGRTADVDLLAYGPSSTGLALRSMQGD